MIIFEKSQGLITLLILTFLRKKPHADAQIKHRRDLIPPLPLPLRRVAITKLDMNFIVATSAQTHKVAFDVRSASVDG